MLLTLVKLVSQTALAVSPAHGGKLSIPICDMGAHYAFETAKCTFELRNEGDRAVRVSEVKPLIEGDSISPSHVIVPAEGAVYLEATLHLRDVKGMVGHSFELTTDESRRKRTTATVQGYVQSVLDQPRPTIDFGVVTMETATWPIEKTISLDSREVSNLRVTRVDSSPDWLDVRIDSDGRTVHASLKKTAPWGVIYDGKAYIKVGLNAPQQKTEWIEVKGDFRGPVVPDGNPLQLGVLKATGDHDFLLRLSSPTGQDFHLGKMSLKGIEGKVSAKQCIPAAPGCRLAKVTVSKKQPLGGLRGQLLIELPDFGRTLPVELRGYLLSEGTKIHSLDEISNTKSSAAPSASPVVDLAAALENAVKPEVSPPPGEGPLLRWSAANQSRIYGYVIYRADAEDGPLLRVNNEVILAHKQGKDLSGAYQWRDETTKSGQTYWYQIGVLNRDGTKEDLSVRQKAIAK